MKCGSQLIGGSCSTPPPAPTSQTPLPPFLPQPATLHCPAKCWQLVTNGLHCTLWVSCPWRRTVVEESRAEEEGSGESLHQQGAWHRWLKINTDPASDLAWQHKSSGVWESAECHTQLNWMMEGLRAREEQRGEGGARTRYSTLSQWHSDRLTRTHSEYMPT